MFDENVEIDGDNNITEFVRRGYQHQIQCMVIYLSSRFHRLLCEQNEQLWWNKLYSKNLNGLAIYVKNTLACQKRVIYENEAEEILLRWESIICNSRVYLDRYGKKFDDNFEAIAKNNLARYALWKSYLLAKKFPETRQKETEDCFLLSAVISPQIIEENVYKNMERYIIGRDKSVVDYLNNYFASNGMN